MDASTFVNEISSHSESGTMTALDKTYKYPVQTSINNTSDIQNGLVYVYGFDITSFDRFKTGSMNQHSLVNVEEAIWIEPKRGNNAKPTILSFRSDPPIFFFFFYY